MQEREGGKPRTFPRPGETPVFQTDGVPVECAPARIMFWAVFVHNILRHLTPLSAK